MGLGSRVGGKAPGGLGAEIGAGGCEDGPRACVRSWMSTPAELKASLPPDIQCGQRCTRQRRHNHRLPVWGQDPYEGHRCKCSCPIQPVQHDIWERGHVCGEPGQESRWAWASASWQGQAQRPQWPTVTSATLREVSGSGDHHQGAACLPSRGLRAHGEPKLVLRCRPVCRCPEEWLPGHRQTAGLQHGH